MRVDNLVNQRQTSTSTNTEGKKIFGLDPKKTKAVSNTLKIDGNSVVERILNEPAPITTRELNPCVFNHT